MFYLCSIANVEMSYTVALGDLFIIRSMSTVVYFGEIPRLYSPGAVNTQQCAKCGLIHG